MNSELPSEETNGKTVVLFAAHKWSKSSFNEFRRIRKACGDRIDLFLLWDSNGNARFADKVEGCQRFEFEQEKLPDLGYEYFGAGLQPGSVHFPLLMFGREHRYEHYWFVEYDVRFGGDWSALFDHFESAEHDFISTSVLPYPGRADWHWWDALSHPEEAIAIEDRVMSFNPAYRISGRALDYIHDAHLAGWRGHQEVLIPTLLKHGGFQLRDLGGIGPLVEPGDEERFYRADRAAISESPRRQRATMRFRPHFYAPHMFSKALLYHPVSDDWTHYWGQLRARLKNRLLLLASDSAKLPTETPPHV